MSQPPDRVTLEDLLRLKRDERPPAEFWSGFDRELHAKQLAALVEKKPWWSSMPRLLARFSYLPLGATAALALAFVAVRQYRQPVPETIRPAGLEASSPMARADASPAAESSPVQPQVKAVSPPVISVVAEKTPVNAPDISAPREISTAIAWLADALQATEAGTPATRSMAANLGMVHAVDSELASGSDSVVVVKARLAVDPLAQVSSPGETRQARLLAALTDNRLASATESTSVRKREHVASSLADEDFADDMNRLGVDGDRVSFKF